MMMRNTYRPNAVGPTVNAAYTALLVLSIIICLCPVAFVVIISLSSQTSIDRIGYSFLPIQWTLDAYRGIADMKNSLGHPSVLQAMLTSTGITIVGTTLGLFLISSMGYVLSRPYFKFRYVYTALVVIPMIFDGGLLSTYVVNTQLLGLRNTLWAIILPLACSSLYVIFMRAWFMSTLPEEMIESGRIDGAGQIRIFFQLVLPVSLPALSAIGLLMCFNYWNDWYQASLYIESRRSELYPLQYLLVSIEQSIAAQTRGGGSISPMMESVRPQETMRMAVVVITILPTLLIFPIFSRTFASGIALGAVKG